jgi:hypothetical protein
MKPRTINKRRIALEDQIVSESKYVHCARLLKPQRIFLRRNQEKSHLVGRPYYSVRLHHDYGGGAQAPAGVPVFAFDKAKSSIGLNVKASVAIAGKFDKWDATMTFNRGAVLNEARRREKSAIT